MKLGGFRLFRIAGIDVVVDYSWLIVFFLVAYTLAVSYFPKNQLNYSATQYWMMGAAGAALFFCSVLVHELAHSLVAIKYGLRVATVRLLIFGGVSDASSEPQSGKQEFLIALAGPVASMTLGMLSLVMFVVLPDKVTPLAGMAWIMAWANIVLALLNLIPGFPLDGGRILRAFLWDHWSDMPRATRVVGQVGNGFALFLIIFGILQFLVTQSIVSGLWFIFIGLFMKQSATGNYQAVMLRNALSGVQVRQIMTENMVTVDWLTSIDELIKNYIYKHQFTQFPVFNRDEFVGMVSLEEVKTVSRELWIFKQVRDVMTPLHLIPCLTPSDDAAEALSRMASHNMIRMPVVEDGALKGIVSREDILKFFRIKSDLGVA